jgi:hypothetical protein
MKAADSSFSEAVMLPMSFVAILSVKRAKQDPPVNAPRWRTARCANGGGMEKQAAVLHQ